MPFRSYGGTNLDLAPNRNMRRYILLSDELRLIMTDSLFMEVCQIFIHFLVVPQINQDIWFIKFAQKKCVATPLCKSKGRMRKHYAISDL